MKMKIAQNIKILRKQHSFTQEQLSEALGVTVSAVYKWESGQSIPEVKMLMELADLFEVSVDTLLGYDRQNENIESRLKRIEQFITERDFEEAIMEGEKALKKYPNHFEVVYMVAQVYLFLFYEKQEEKVMEKAIELLYSAIPLLYQNKESSINETTIYNLIGSIYIQAEQIEKGVEILKKNNISGINSDTIGLTYARMKQPEEAKTYLYQAYIDNMNSTLSTTFGMILMFAEQKNERYKEAATFLLNYLENMVVDKEKVTFIYKYKGILFAELALISAKFQRYDEVETYITEACQYALRFDAEPSYLTQDIKLLKDEDVPALLLDGLGETAILAIENFVFNNEEPSEALDFVKKRFEELKHEGING